MDQLVLDPQVLRSTAELIRGYCRRQKEILEEYASDIRSLGDEWQDDDTFSTMFAEITDLTRRSEAFFEEICYSYPEFFEQKAAWLERRPQFDAHGYSLSYDRDTIGTPSAGGVTSTDGSRVITGVKTTKQKIWPFSFGLARKSAQFGEGISIKKDPVKPEQYFCAGGHYKAFLEYWTNMGTGKYCYEDFPDPNTIQTVFIRARDIEGVYLNKGEVNNAEGFWTRHGLRDYSKESIRRKASLIPNVKKLLDSGIPRYEISEHPELGAAYGSYFANPIQVCQLDDFFVFTTEGRHRTIAAQSLDQFIPVRIIGRIVKK